MDTIGFDLHKRESQRCTVGHERNITEQRIAATRERLPWYSATDRLRAFCLRPRRRASGSLSCWNSWGHEVIVADPSFAPMYATPSRRVKTDRRDARALAEALRLGAFEAFLGLVPGDLSSGEKRRIGRITKRGDVRSRYLLVEAGWRVLRSKRPETAALRAWALTIAPRRAGTVFDRDD